MYDAGSESGRVKKPRKKEENKLRNETSVACDKAILLMKK